MNERDEITPESDRGACVALIYALTSERLAVFYEHGVWMTPAQGATRAADWLARSKRNMTLAMRKHLSALSDALARQIAATTSREAGLFISHEMQESLDPRYRSEVGQSIMVECERMLDGEPPPQ